MDYKGLFTNLLKMCTAGFISLVICFIAATGFDTYIHLPKAMFEILKITSIGIICLVTYTGLNLMFKMEYATELSKRLINKIRR